MPVEDLKWYSPIVFLVGAILSFADPITDILTLLEFYRTGHKTWFGVGLCFVILPCLLFSLFYHEIIYRRQQVTQDYSDTRKYIQTFLCGFHPFSAAFVRLECFINSLKIYYNTKVFPEYDAPDDLLEQMDILRQYSVFMVVSEAACESMPQFIIQLYAISVQEEPVEVIQIISLSTTFLSLAWTVTLVDEMVYNEVIGNLKLKLKLVLFLPNLLFVASGLLSYVYFIVSFKWWVIAVVLFGGLAPMCTFAIMYFLMRNIRFPSINLSCLYLTSDDLSVHSDDSDESANMTNMQRITLLFYIIIIVLENYFMILMYYFSQHSNKWYSLPVTVCVCVFSVISVIVRAIVYHFLFKERLNDTDDSNA